MAAWFTDKDWQKLKDIVWFADEDSLGIWKIKNKLYLFYWYQHRHDFSEYFVLKLNKTGLDQINHDRNVRQFIVDNKNTNCQIVRIGNGNHLLGLRKPTKEDLLSIDPIFDKIDYDYLNEKELPKDKVFFGQ